MLILHLRNLLRSQAVVLGSSAFTFVINSFICSNITNGQHSNTHILINYSNTTYVNITLESQNTLIENQFY